MIDRHLVPEELEKCALHAKEQRLRALELEIQRELQADAVFGHGFTITPATGPTRWCAAQRVARLIDMDISLDPIHRDDMRLLRLKWDPNKADWAWLIYAQGNDHHAAEGHRSMEEIAAAWRGNVSGTAETIKCPSSENPTR